MNSSTRTSTYILQKLSRGYLEQTHPAPAPPKDDWKFEHLTSPRLRLSLDVITYPTPNPRPKYVMKIYEEANFASFSQGSQSNDRIQLHEELDLSIFSYTSSGIALRAVVKDNVMAIKYAVPQAQLLKQYQLKFVSVEDTQAFVSAISPICPVKQFKAQQMPAVSNFKAPANPRSRSIDPPLTPFRGHNHVQQPRQKLGAIAALQTPSWSIRDIPSSSPDLLHPRLIPNMSDIDGWTISSSAVQPSPTNDAQAKGAHFDGRAFSGVPCSGPFTGYHEDFEPAYPQPAANDVLPAAPSSSAPGSSPTTHILNHRTSNQNGRPPLLSPYSSQPPPIPASPQTHQSGNLFELSDEAIELLLKEVVHEPGFDQFMVRLDSILSRDDCTGWEKRLFPSLPFLNRLIVDGSVLIAMSYSPIFQPIIDTTTTTTDAPGPTTKSGPPRPGGLPNGTSNTQALVYIYPTVLALAGLLAAVYAFRIYGTRRRRAAARLAAMEDALRRLGPVLPPPEKPIWHAAYLTPAWESQNAQSSWNDIKPVSVTISRAETPSLSPSPSSPPAPVIPSPFHIPAIFKKARRQRQRGDPEQQVEDTVAANITTRENSADDRLITSVMIAMPCQRGGGKDSELDWDDDILPEVLFGSEDVRWRADTKLSGNP